jgi:LacI family transcriptional regulator
MAERRRGFRTALSAAGRALDPDLQLTGLHDVADAAHAISTLLHTAGPPDGLFCANNRCSLGALHAFRETGRRVPMVGFDDFEAATVVQPAVSVVSQDVQEMGRRAAEQLMARIGGDRQPPRRVVLPTTVTVRGSELP